jgi:uncharacterized membrane protein
VALAFALTLAALAWAAALLTAPLLAAPASGLLYAAGSLICHQLPERSFYLGAFQLPVCARCTGIYLGGAAGAVATMTWRITRRRALTRIRTTHIRTVLLAGAVPTAVTFGLEWLGGWPMTNEVRALAGLPLGAAVAFVVTGAPPTLHYDECPSPRPIGHGQSPPI